VIVSATLGQALFQFAGAKLRERIRWQPIRAVDAVGGAALSAAAVLLVAWALGLAVTGSRIDGITPAVRNSLVLDEVNEVLPRSATQALQAFNDVVGTSFFPRYLEPFARETIVDVGAPPQRLLRDPDVERAAESVLKIHGDNSCGRGVEGTGFLYADNRLMTNAHVVAGVDDPEVLIGGDTVAATIVLYDPELDIAVLAFDDGGRPDLGFDFDGEASQGAAVLGYPEDGPYDVQPARIRAEQRLRSPNIYGDGSVLRDVFSVRGSIRPGNSGGPMVSSAGDVLGVVFAASVTDNDTGYALTAEQVSQAAARGSGNTAEADSGDCAG
jgi:S1-C subfamily serine protease